jgi:hypothetical protein
VAEREVFEMLSGEDGAGSCSNEEVIDSLVLCVSCRLHPNKEQWPIAEIIKCDTRYGLG